MARTRVFVSSTFYDLKFARSELERFIREMGFDPVLNEKGHIPYGSAAALEEYCYNEVQKVNILVSIIGGRFGSQSKEMAGYSISNQELKAAIKQKKQVYIFIDSGVYSEYQTYLRNKDSKIHYSHVDDERIYKFIEEIYTLPINNQIASFENIPGIIGYLKEQWSGLFERFLSQQSQQQVLEMIERLESTSNTLSSLVNIFRSEQSTLENKPSISENIVNGLLLQNHPLFSHLAKILRIPCRVFFANYDELWKWLKWVRGGIKVEESSWDDKNYMEFLIKLNGKTYVLALSKDLFDNSLNLKPIPASDWDDDFVRFYEYNDADDNDGETGNS